MSQNRKIAPALPQAQLQQMAQQQYVQQIAAQAQSMVISNSTNNTLANLFPAVNNASPSYGGDQNVAALAPELFEMYMSCAAEKDLLTRKFCDLKDEHKKLQNEFDKLLLCYEKLEKETFDAAIKNHPEKEFLEGMPFQEIYYPYEMTAQTKISLEKSVAMHAERFKNQKLREERFHHVTAQLPPPPSISLVDIAVNTDLVTVSIAVNTEDMTPSVESIAVNTEDIIPSVKSVAVNTEPVVEEVETTQKEEEKQLKTIGTNTEQVETAVVITTSTCTQTTPLKLTAEFADADTNTSDHEINDLVDEVENISMQSAEVARMPKRVDSPKPKSDLANFDESGNNNKETDDYSVEVTPVRRRLYHRRSILEDDFGNSTMQINDRSAEVAPTSVPKRVGRSRSRTFKTPTSNQTRSRGRGKAKAKSSPPPLADFSAQSSAPDAGSLDNEPPVFTEAQPLRRRAQEKDVYRRAPSTNSRVTFKEKEKIDDASVVAKKEPGSRKRANTEFMKPCVQASPVKKNTPKSVSQTMVEDDLVFETPKLPTKRVARPRSSSARVTAKSNDAKKDAKQKKETPKKSHTKTDDYGSTPRTPNPVNNEPAAAVIDDLLAQCLTEYERFQMMQLIGTSELSSRRSSRRQSSAVRK